FTSLFDRSLRYLTSYPTRRSSDLKSFSMMLKMRTSDSLVLVTTFLLTVFVNLTVAVPVGLLLAMVSFVRRISNVLEVDDIKPDQDRKSTRLNSSHVSISYAVFCLK